MPNGGYKVFDSHSRDLFGMVHPYGACNLIEIDSLINLVQYFQNIYVERSNTYEIKGVNIVEMQSNSGNTTNTLHVENNDFTSNELLPRNEIYLCSCKECCAISFYSICFSTLKSNVTIGHLKQLIVSLRMEQHFMRNIMQENMFLFLICQTN